MRIYAPVFIKTELFTLDTVRRLLKKLFKLKILTIPRTVIFVFTVGLGFHMA